MAAGNRHFPFGSRGSMVSGKHSYTATSGRRFSFPRVPHGDALLSRGACVHRMRLAVWQIGPQHPRALSGGRRGEGEEAAEGDGHDAGLACSHLPTLPFDLYIEESNADAIS